MSNFQPLEVVGRGSETQLPVDKKLNTSTQQDKGHPNAAVMLVSIFHTFETGIAKAISIIK